MEWGKMRRKLSGVNGRKLFYMKILLGMGQIELDDGKLPEANGERLIHIYSGLGGTIEGFFTEIVKEGRAYVSSNPMAIFS
jgi:hypothetical protein